MSETWVLWLTIIGILFLLVGIAIAIWASVNNNQYWYWGAIVAGIGVLLLVIALILYVTGNETIPATTCQQPVVNSCCPPSPPQVQHVFYDNSGIPINTQMYGSMLPPQMAQIPQVAQVAQVPQVPQVQQSYVQGSIGPMGPMPSMYNPTAPPLSALPSIQSQTISVPSLNSGQVLNLPTIGNPTVTSATVGTPYLQPLNPAYTQSNKVVY